jgi:hypothetical protein
MARMEGGGFADGLRRALAGIVIVSALAIPSGLLSAQTAREVQTVAERAIRRLDLQTELPRGPQPLPFTLDLPAELLWVVIVVAICVLIYAFRDMIPMWRARHGGAWTMDEVLPGEVAARTSAAVLGAADELAADGRYVEAMHVLLLQGLADIRRGLDQQFADSLTSREILRSVQLPEAGRASLRDIINRVEWTYFGKYPAARADYVACRASFNALATTLHGSQAA